MTNYLNQINMIEINTICINNILKDNVIPINYYKSKLLKQNNLHSSCHNCKRIGCYYINNISYCWVHCQQL
jgi:hypothetical protein